MAKCVVAVLVSGVVVTGFGFCPIFHAYLGEQVAHVLKIEGVTPNIWILANAAYLADVMHLKTERMHDNLAFTGEMMNRAQNIDELTFAMGFRVHQVSDRVWADFAAAHNIPRGGAWTPVEIAHSFFFCAYAVLKKGYVPLFLTFFPELPFYGGLIADTYRAMYNESLSPIALRVARDGMAAMLLGQFFLIQFLSAQLRSALDFAPFGPAALVRKNFDNVVQEVRSRAKMSVEHNWYEFRLVGVFEKELKAGLAEGDKHTFCSAFPRLTDGWERSHWRLKIDQTGGTGYGGPYWRTEDKFDPNVCIFLWANPPYRRIKATIEVFARRKIRPVQTTVHRYVPPGLLEAIRAQPRVFVCADEPLLRPGARPTIAAIEARQRELLTLIGQALMKMHEDLAKLDWQTKQWDNFARIVASAAHQVECWFATYTRLEERKRMIMPAPLK